MNLKPLYISTIVLTILASITYFVKSADSSHAADSRVGQTISADTSLRGVAKIAIQADMQSLTFEYSTDTNNWLLQESYNLPADMSRIGSTITKITDSRLERVASSNPDRIAEFGFNGNAITLSDASDNTVIALELGRETDTGKQLVKFAGEDIAFLINDQIALDSNAIAWLDKTLVKYEQDDVLAATITLLDNSSLNVTRTASTEDWQTTQQLPEGKELDQSALSSAINKFASSSFTDLAETTDEAVTAAQESSIQINLTFADESTLNLTIGQRPEVKVTKEVETLNEDGETVTEIQEEVETPSGPAYLFASSSNTENPINGYMKKAAFEIATYQFTSLPKTLDELLKDIPEPAVEAEASE